MYESLVGELPELIAPAIAWDIFPVQSLLHDHFILSNGSNIGGGPIVDVLCGASEILVGICTVGKRVDERIENLKQSKDMMATVILDSLCSWAVGEVKNRFIKRFREDLKGQGKFYSLAMSPGESDWNITGQREIFTLLDATRIGLRLTDSMMMVPLKSLSFIIGISDQPFGIQDISRCEFCKLKDKCRHRGVDLVALQ